jgi:hypothetical protein
MYDEFLIEVGRRILVPDFWAFFLVSLFSVWIGVLAPRYWKLIKWLLVLLAKLYKAYVRQVGGTIGSRVAESFEHFENLEEHQKRTAEDTAVEIFCLMKKKKKNGYEQYRETPELFGDFILSRDFYRYCDCCYCGELYGFGQCCGSNE